jgi:hypothetical protein
VVIAEHETGRPSTRCDTCLVRFSNGGKLAAVLGPTSTRRLTVTHSIDDFADAMINLSMVGSLFLSVSFDASRERILLYLVLTVLPLALVAPVVGPMLDRSRIGHRSLLASTQFVRVALAAGLVGSLGSLAFYPLVFGVLLSRKAYALGKTGLLAHLTEDEGELVSASGHLARVGTLSGACGMAVAGALLAIVGVEIVPLVAAVGFAVAGAVSLTIPAVKVRASSLDLPIAAIGVPVEVRAASVAVAVLRAGFGALTLLLALAIKRGGGEVWVFAAALIAAGVGSFLGTMVAGAAHRRMSLDRVIVVCLFGPGVVALAGVLSISQFGILAIAAGLGLGGSVASRTMDVLYGRVPVETRARAISHSELRFQIADVVGALLAVLMAPGLRIGFGTVGVVLVLAAAMYASSRQLSVRGITGRLISGDRLLTGEHALDRDLLEEAEFALARSRPRIAIVLAATAARAGQPTEGAGGSTDVNAVIDALKNSEPDVDHARARRAIDEVS